MTESEFRTLDPLADALDEACRPLVRIARTGRSQGRATEGGRIAPADVLRVDRRRTAGLRQRTGTSAQPPHDRPQHRSRGGAVPDIRGLVVHRYVAGGEICEVPHDRCPQCWGSWDYKHERPSCPQCGIQMGSDVRLLLDSDVCPYCDRGRITSDNLTCGECGFTIDPRYVTWG